MNKTQILEYLEQLNEILKERGIRGEICVFGGTAMVLAFNARESTKDVDATIKPKSEVSKAALVVAENNGLPPDWLNDGVKGFIDNLYDLDTVEIENYSNLTIHSPKPEYLFAMKAIASRADTNDLEDIIFLKKYLGLSSLDQALSIVEKYYSKNRIPQKTYFLLEEIFEVD